MGNKSLNLKFLNIIIESDFLIISKNNLKNRFITQIDLENLIKSLKQFIRILQILKQNKSTNFSIIVENKQKKFFVDKYIKFNDKNFKVGLKVQNLVNTSNSLQSLLFVDIPFPKNLNNVKKLVSQNIYLITTLSTFLENQDFGFYKVYNDTKDIKKVIFLISLINSILKN
jgi:hypothetical protein